MRWWIEILMLSNSKSLVPIAPITEQGNLTATDDIRSDEFSVAYKLFKSNFNLPEMNFSFYGKGKFWSFSH